MDANFKKTVQLHLDTLIDISKARAWFAKLTNDEPKTTEEQNLVTEITFKTDLLLVEIHKSQINEK